jgi:hypothetical protein
MDNVQNCDSCINIPTNQPTNQLRGFIVRKRTIPTERPPLVGKVSANFCGYWGVAWSVRRIPYGRDLDFLDGLH